MYSLFESSWSCPCSCEFRATEFITSNYGTSLPIFYQLTRIGMESGELPDFLMKAAGLMEREAERKASRFRAILEPAMLLLVGGMTAIVVFSVILPVFHMAARV